MIIVELLLANHHRQKRLKRPDNTNYYLSKDELTCELRKAHFSSTGNDASSMIIGKASKEQCWVTSSKLGFSDWKYESPTGKSQLPSKFAAGKYSLSLVKESVAIAVWREREILQRKGNFTCVREINILNR